MRCLALTDITAASEGVHLNEEIHRLKRLYTVTHHTSSPGPGVFLIMCIVKNILMCFKCA